jgi:hypothetical protein
LELTEALTKYVMKNEAHLLSGLSKVPYGFVTGKLGHEKPETFELEAPPRFYRQD